MNHWLTRLETETPSSLAHFSQRPPPRNPKRRTPRTRARALKHTKRRSRSLNIAAQRHSRMTPLPSQSRGPGDTSFSYHQRPRTLPSSRHTLFFFSYVANVFLFLGRDTSSQWGGHEYTPNQEQSCKMLTDPSGRVL